MLTIVLNDEEYEMSTSLRVAYKIQGEHSHKTYAEVFAGVDDMRLEQQIDLLYIAFKVANPDHKMTKNEFRDAFLDKYGLKHLMEFIGQLMEGIMYVGMSPDEIEEAKKQTAQIREQQKTNI